MDIKVRKTVDMLTEDSVSILTQKFINIDGVDTQVGENHRAAYINSEGGRNVLAQEQPKDVVSAVMAIWVPDPTIEDNIDEEEIV